MQTENFINVSLTTDLSTKSSVYQKNNWVWDLCVTTFNKYQTFFQLVPLHKKKIENPGIYLIVIEDENFKLSIYVGKSENSIKSRIQHHERSNKIKFTKRTKIYFFHSEKIFKGLHNMGNLKYFESKFIDYFLKNDKHYECLNGQTPQDIGIDPDNNKIFKQMLSFFSFLAPESLTFREEKTKTETPDPKNHKEENKNDSKIYLNFVGSRRDGGEFHGHAFWNKDKITIQKGSWTHVQNLECNNWFKNNDEKLYNFLFDNQYLLKTYKPEKEIHVYEFNKDWTFNSPSQAARVLRGTSTNGWISWKNITSNKTLDEEVRKSKKNTIYPSDHLNKNIHK